MIDLTAPNGRRYIINERFIAEAGTCFGHGNELYGIRIMYVGGGEQKLFWEDASERDAVLDKIATIMACCRDGGLRMPDTGHGASVLKARADASSSGSRGVFDGGGNKPVQKSMDLEDLGLINRSYNALIRGGIRNVDDLLGIRFEAFSKMKNLGRRCAEDVVRKVHEAGLMFSDNRIEVRYL